MGDGEEGEERERRCNNDSDELEIKKGLELDRGGDGSSQIVFSRQPLFRLNRLVIAGEGR